MEWQLQLIGDYIEIEKVMQCSSVPRRWHRNDPDFSDAEVLAIYFLGLRLGLRNVKKIHAMASTILLEWFPKIPCYEQYLRRLNKLGSVCRQLCVQLYLLDEKNQKSKSIAIDSAPVIVAKQGRSSKARVAPNICNKGYNSSKKCYFYGFKLHLATYTKNRAPYLIAFAEITPASVHDIKILHRTIDSFKDFFIYGDKAYRSKALQIRGRENGSEIITPMKKPKDRCQNLCAKLMNSVISSTRQVIESTFSWLERRSGIFQASHLRSSKGIIRHVYGALLRVNLGLV
jgi:hypothetical protein